MQESDMADHGYDPTKDPHLATWRERSQMGIRRMLCPGCGRPGYKPYIHPDGQIVAEQCGRCDHESSCGYHVSPKEWFKDHPVGTEHYNPSYVPPPPPPAVIIPPVMAHRFHCLRQGAPRNPLLRYWANLFASVGEGRKELTKLYTDRLKKALKAFNVGTMDGGYTVWWIIDEEGKIRSGKAMKYKADGHRDKEDQRAFAWMHTMPEVKRVQKEGAEYVGCLFGLHQLTKELKEVQLVESEKTAVLMSVFRPDLTWMATMGLGNLNQYKLQPLIAKGVTITCHPDKDGYDKWRAQVEKIRKDCPQADISVSDYVEKAWMPGDSPHADILDMMERDWLIMYS